MQLVKTVLFLVDEARIIDNSSKDNPFQQIVVMKSGNYEAKADSLPEWWQGICFQPDENSTRNMLASEPQMFIHLI